MSATQEGAGVVHADGLTRSFGSLVAVHPFEVRLEPGQVTGLLGPNGSGKSTFLRMLLGLVPRDGGRARVDGVELAGDGRAVRARATYTPGETAVYGELKARAHLAWLLRGRPGEAFRRAVAIAADLELPLGRRVRGFSHGMKRQLFLAAALAPDVRVRILDEPTEGLDPTKRGQVLDLLQAEAARGRTILLSSHHLGEVDRACDRTLFLKAGELLDEAEARRLHERAKRALRIVWREDVDVPATRELLRPLGEAKVEARRATVFLPEGDPRHALARVVEQARLPEPESLTYGTLTLQELYRELYGTEGV